jgi:predicted nuclease of predicted toxin-antitoxin system
MKFLADMGISMTTVQALCKEGHDAVHLREQQLHRLSDAAILDKARQEGRIVLSSDLDFGDLLAAGLHQFPSVMLFRLHDQTPSSVTPKLLAVLAQRRRELESGAVVVVEDARYRLRRLPIEKMDDDQQSAR